MLRDTQQNTAKGTLQLIHEENKKKCFFSSALKYICNNQLLRNTVQGHFYCKSVRLSIGRLGSDPRAVTRLNPISTQTHQNQFIAEINV